MDDLFLFHEVVYALDKEKLIKMVEEGLSLHTINNYEGLDQQNIAMEILLENWGEKAFDIIEILLENGLDIDHQDSDGDTLVIYILDSLSWSNYEVEMSEEGVASKYELRAMHRLRQTFDKLMELSPDLSRKGTDDVFQVAVGSKCSYWFEPHLENMDMDDRNLYESYRLVRLFE